MSIDYNQPIDADEWLRGQRDCEQGVPHKSGQSISYDRGYATQYEREQVEGANHG